MPGLELRKDPPRQALVLQCCLATDPWRRYQCPGAHSYCGQLEPGQGLAQLGCLLGTCKALGSIPPTPKHLNQKTMCGSGEGEIKTFAC